MMTNSKFFTQQSGEKKKKDRLKDSIGLHESEEDAKKKDWSSIDNIVLSVKNVETFASNLAIQSCCLTYF